jgi:hypothetical protein
LSDKKNPAAGDSRVKADSIKDNALVSATAAIHQAQKRQFGEVTFVDHSAAREWRCAWSDVRLWAALGWRP